MKFACVELYTKSGRIWDGARQQPNYLCDPSEIDNASFGCWTSALKGEHVPLLWFKFRKPMRRFYHGQMAPRMSKFNYAGYSIISRLFNNAFEDFNNLDYLSKFDVVLVVVHDYSIRAMAKFVTAAKKLQKKPIILGAFGVTLNFMREALKEPENFKHFKIFIDNCDVFVNYYHEAISDYLKLFTSTPVVNFPQFYPFEFAKSFFTPIDGKEQVIFISGHSQRTDHVASMLVARKVQELHPEFTIELVGRPKQSLEPLQGANFRVAPFQRRWADYMEKTKKNYLVLDLDNTWTLGRVVRDAAAVGSPCIGLNSGSQASLFPDLVCRDIIDTDKAIELGAKLIEDKSFYRGVQRKAFEKLEECSFENSVKRLHNMLKEYAGADFSQ